MRDGGWGLVGRLFSKVSWQRRGARKGASGEFGWVGSPARGERGVVGGACVRRHCAAVAQTAVQSGIKLQFFFFFLKLPHTKDAGQPSEVTGSPPAHPPSAATQVIRAQRLKVANNETSRDARARDGRPQGPTKGAKV